MHVKRLLTLVGSALLVGAAPAQDRVPLTDDASRGVLFDLMLSYLQTEAAPPDKVLYAFPAAFTFAHDALWTNPAADLGPRANQIFGVDLSHHNMDSCKCTVDWSLLWKQRVRFAYLKASQGAKYFDPTFNTYRDGAKAAPADSRIPVGAYHFLSADGDGLSQAKWFLSVVSGKVTAEDLPPTVDLEWDVRVANGKVILGPDGKPKDFWEGTDGEEILRRTVDWLEAVAKATGRAPLVYTNRAWWKQRIGAEDKVSKLGKYRVWIADYSASGLKLEKPSVPANTPWTLWQFTSGAQFAAGGVGKGARADANVFNGTEDDFRKALGLTP